MEGELDIGRELLALQDELANRERGRKFYTIFPTEGEFSRDKYPRQIEFFTLGSKKPYRCLTGSNGCGKSVCGGFETVCHMTGIYPDWWEGKRFNRPINAWICAVDFKAIRESLQFTLLGKKGSEGTGLIPRDLIVGSPKYRTHPAETLDFVEVHHISGGISRAVIKSYEEGAESFQAANVDWIWLDEEPDWDIYSECAQRFRGETKDGQLILTFTPLHGMSEVVTAFIPAFMENMNMEQYEASGRAHVNCDIEDVPHISEEERLRKAANMKPHERSARLHGLPTVGAGLIYPVEEESFVIKPFPIPDHYPRLYGFDPGLLNSGVVWVAHDRETDVIYVNSDYLGRDQLPPVHASAIKARGVWIPGVIDTASKQGNAQTGEHIFEVYTNAEKYKHGLKLRKADNKKGSVEDGIHEVLTRLVEGRLKIFSTCQETLREIRKYSRNKRMEVIKNNDHMVDALRYAVVHINMAVVRLSDYRNLNQKIREETYGIYN
jgi:phage terminase large subunit-like protein